DLGRDLRRAPLSEHDGGLLHKNDFKIEAGVYQTGFRLNSAPAGIPVGAAPCGRPEWGKFPTLVTAGVWSAQRIAVEKIVRVELQPVPVRQSHREVPMAVPILVDRIVVRRGVVPEDQILIHDALRFAGGAHVGDVREEVYWSGFFHGTAQLVSSEGCHWLTQKSYWDQDSRRPDW